MIRQLIGVTIFAASLASTTPAPAEEPMSPIRPRSPGVVRIAPLPVAAQDPAAAVPVPAPPPVAGEAKKPKPEPLAVADIPPPASPVKPDAPAPVAAAKDGPKPDTVQPPPPPTNEPNDKAEAKTARQQRKPQAIRAAYRPRPRVYAYRYAAPLHSWSAYRRAGWAGTSMPYTPGFGPAPYSSSGN